YDNWPRRRRTSDREQVRHTVVDVGLKGSWACAPRGIVGPHARAAGHSTQSGAVLLMRLGRNTRKTNKRERHGTSVAPSYILSTSSTPAYPLPLCAVLLHRVDHVEDRQVHGDDHAADDDAEEDDHHRFEQ